MTFPGNIKGCGNAFSLSFSLHSLKQQTRQLQHEESASNFWTIVFSEIIPLSFIHSFSTNWSSTYQIGFLFPALTFAAVFFYLYDSQYKGFRLKLTLKFLELTNILIHSFFFPPFLNITRQKPNTSIPSMH